MNTEIKLIRNMRRRNPNAALVVLWVKFKQRGYTRRNTGLYRILKKLSETRKSLPNPKYIPKPYEKMYYPGQRVQVDVKFVPSACIVGGAEDEKFYQDTAIDEYSRFRYIEASKNIVHIHQLFFLNICSTLFRFRFTVFRLITI